MDSGRLADALLALINSMPRTPTKAEIVSLIETRCVSPSRLSTINKIHASINELVNGHFTVRHHQERCDCSDGDNTALSDSMRGSVPIK